MLQHNTDNTDEEVFVETSTPNRRPIFKKRKQVDKTSLIWNHVKHLIELTLYGMALPKSNTNRINYLGHINSFQKIKNCS